MFDRMVNQITTTSAGGGVGSSTSAQAAAALVRIGVINSDRLEKANDEPLKEEDGNLSVGVAEKMLKWHAEAIGRCVELSPPSDVYVHITVLVDNLTLPFSPKNTFILLRVLAEAISTSYADLALETSVPNS